MKFAKRLLNTSSVLGMVTMALIVSQPAMAAGTDAGISITNIATVNYSVGAVSQTEIESSPVGNSTPGAGAGLNTAFTVDNRVDLTLAEVDGLSTQVNPGQANVVTTFLLTNTGNAAQDYALSALNLATGTVVHGGDADTIQANNLRVFADSDNSGDYTPGDFAFVDTLPANAGAGSQKLLFVVADIPIGATNGDFANVSMTVVTADAGTGGATATAETVGGDTLLVDVVFADAGNDGTETAEDGYEVASAALTVTKVEALISDPINLTVNPLHIPGAVVEYIITVVNTGSADATAVSVTDVINANLAVLLAQYNAGADDIQYTVGGVTAFCTADAADADADNCGLSGATLEADVAVTLGTNAGVDNTLEVRFRATIQ